MTQGLNDIMKNQAKGIAYNEALENKKSLNTLKEKERFYNEQISSLKSALQQAEEQASIEKDDDIDQRVSAKSNIMVQKIIGYLKEKYEEACKKANEEPDYSQGGFSLETLEKLLRKEEGRQAMNGRQNLFDNEMEHLSENVAKGLQRISMKFMNNQLKLVPVNSLTKADEDGSERTRGLFEKARDKIFELALKVIKASLFDFTALLIE